MISLLERNTWGYIRLAAAFMVLFVVLALPAWGKMETSLELIGFSEDGSYVAYQVLEPYTESGYALSSIFVVDVVKNDFAVEDIVIKTDFGHTEPELLIATREKARPILDRFGIVEGNSGVRVYKNPGAPTWGEKKAFLKKAEFSIGEGDTASNYSVMLEEREVETDKCPNLDMFGTNPRIFTLSLAGDGWVKILQRDQVLYTSRHYPYAYTVYSVYAYADRVAVFLNAYTFGFEGDDVYKLIVTGTIAK